LNIIFSNTATLGGWGQGELIALLGVWRLVNTLMIALVWPNTQKFNTSVRDGSLDYTFLQPANSQFLVSFSRIVIWRAWDVVLAGALIVIGIRMSGGGAVPLNIANFLLLTVSGTLIIYSLWIVMIAFTFWLNTRSSALLLAMSALEPSSSMTILSGRPLMPPLSLMSFSAS